MNGHGGKVWGTQHLNIPLLRVSRYEPRASMALAPWTRRHPVLNGYYRGGGFEFAVRDAGLMSFFRSGSECQ